MIREIEEESIEAFKDPVLVKERQERQRISRSSQASREQGQLT